MAKVVFLHGGPWHGRTLSMEDERDHVHIIMSVPEQAPSYELWFEGSKIPTTYQREGTYSQVSGPGNYNNFEWDGWRT